MDEDSEIVDGYESETSDREDGEIEEVTEIPSEPNVSVQISNQTDLYPNIMYQTRDVDDDMISTVDSEITFNRAALDCSNQISWEHNRINKDVDPFKAFQGNIAFEQYIKSMVAKELELEKKKLKDEAAKAVPTQNRTFVEKDHKAQTGGQAIGTPKTGVAGIAQANNPHGDLVKSPSDTTIYAPALQRITNSVDRTKDIVGSILNTDNQMPNESGEKGIPMLGITEQISNFIEGVRMEAKSPKIPSVIQVPVNQPLPSTSGEQPRVNLGPDPFAEQIDAAKQKANQLILDAEHYKATVNIPPGNYTGVNIESNNLEAVSLNDDDFFHVTCHVDPILKAKIEKGEYIDLERLLPKQRSSLTGNEDNWMNLIQREGQVYFIPAANNNKINSVRKWEQAFRIYTAIYSQANPSGAAEIWQYVHTINVAASGYIWENVFNYDITFRHLMSQNPNRSWSKIYNQMWNMSLRDVLPRNANTNFQNGQNGRRTSNGNGPRKPKYCWGHNKGNCKDGAGKC